MMDENKDTYNVREVELTGPPYGLRIGAATTTTIINTTGESVGVDGENTTVVVGGVKIARVNPESKASNAGLRDGDLILSVNGEQVQIPQPNNTTTNNATSSSSAASNSSQSPSSQQQDQHHKILGLLHGDRVRLSVLSKKSKSAKKLEKALAKGEFEQKQQKQNHDDGNHAGPPSVQWADGKTSGKMLNEDDNDTQTEDNMTNNTDTDKMSEKIIMQEEENGCLAPQEGSSQLGQDIHHLLYPPKREREEPPSFTSPSANNSANLLSEIIDELQLAADTTAKFLSDMEANLQEQVDNMQPGPQGLLRQVSSSTPPPPKVSKFIPGGGSTTTTPPSSASVLSSSMPYPSSLLIKQEDLHQMKSTPSASGGDGEEILPIWSPPGVPPSPKLGKKFRPVTFNANSSVPSSPVLTNQNGISSTPAQSPGGILSPPSEPSLSVSNSFDNSFSKHFSNSSHSSSTTTNTNTTSSNLPRYQSPTVVLLQKAREGQLPKGAAYLTQPTPPPKPKFSNKAFDNDTSPRISSSVNFSLSQPSCSSSNSNGMMVNQTEPVTISYSHPPPPRPSNRSRPNEIINIPTTSKSTLSGEKEQRDWYKKMYESLHVERRQPSAASSPGAKCTYPAGRIKTGPPMKSFWAKRVHSNGTVSEPEDFDGPEEEEFDFNKFGNKVLSPLGSAPTSTRPPGAIRFHNPGRIEDYNPAGGMGTTAARKQRYHRQMQPDMKRHWALKNLNAAAGYESDSNYIMRKRTDSPGMKTPEPSPLSPAVQRHMYMEIQKGGEVPLEGLRKYVPGPGLEDGFRTASPSQNIRYSESTVNIHYRAPVRIEEKEYVPEDELRRRQQEAMKLLYEKRREQKYMQELQDMESRRHSDNFVASQKSPIPLNRYEDGDVFDGLIDNTPPRPGSGGLWQRMRSPEPMSPSNNQKMNGGGGGPPIAIARVKFNFTAQSARELQLQKGDLVNIRRKIDANWYEGEIRQQGTAKNSYFYPNGTTGGSSPLGIFPCTYVEILPDDPSSPATIAKYSSQQNNKDAEGVARVLFNFRPSHSFELELSKGEIVILTRRVDNNWFEGRKQKNPILSGIFPVSYVDVVKDIGGVSSANTRSKSPLNKKPVGQPVGHSLSYASDTDDFSLNKHHYKPNEFVLQDDDYGEVFSPTPSKQMNDRNSRNKRRMNQRLELITIDTRLNNDQPFRYRAIYNYKPVHNDELELREGDIIEVLEKCEDGWWVGTSQRSGLFGTFPGNYMEKV